VRKENWARITCMALTSKISSPYVRELSLNETMDCIGGGPRFVVECMLGRRWITADLGGT